MTCETAPMEQSFREQGFVVVPGALSAREITELQAEVEDAMAEFPVDWSSRYIRSQMHVRGPGMKGLIDHEPVVSMAERLLAYEPGERLDEVPPEQCQNCHILNMTAYVTHPGDPGHHWHVDDVLLLPRPADVPWDPRIPFPTLIVTAMYYLTDVGPEDGPTELVPGSHRAGRRPEPHAERPEYDGQGPKAVLLEAGDCLLFHSQIWHHALAHTGAQSRTVVQVHYGARFMAPRYFPFPNYHMPARLLERLSARQQRLLGVHTCRGQYT